jgi:HSP20 family protein
MVFNGNLIPWNWGKKHLPVKKENSSHSEQTPYVSLQQDMNNRFESFFRAFESEMFMPLSQFAQGSRFQPRVEMKESAKDVRVSAELPGIEDKDLDISIDSHYLTIKGEKREEKEDETSGYYRMERHYGSFERTIPLPCEIDKEKAEATFKRAVLTVLLPKSTSARHEVKKIPVRKA